MSESKAKLLELINEAVKGWEDKTLSYEELNEKVFQIQLALTTHNMTLSPHDIIPDQTTRELRHLPRYAEEKS